jgi:ABC-type nitrate/sulfonate/bicarbonate transport system substrate-binding protein
MKRTLTLVLVVLASCSRAAATKQVGDFETDSLRYEGQAGYVTPAELAEHLGYLAPIRLSYVGNNATGGPHSIAAVVSGDLDFGSSFNGAIIKLVAAKAPLRAVVAAYGTDELTFQGFYVLDESPIRGPRDQRG